MCKTRMRDFLFVLICGALATSVAAYGQVIHTWDGLVADGDLGTSVAIIRDVNGDLRDDAILGMPGFNADTGRVVCYSGASGSILWTSTGNAGSRYGASVAMLGDLNGDGISEVFVGGPGNAASAGYAQVLNGATGAFIRQHIGPANSDGGFFVADVSDINGDGISDYAMGQPGHNANAGRVNLYSGATGSFIRALNGSGNERLGSAIAGGRDVDGDGVADILVGAPLNDDNGTNCGRVALFSGSNGVLLAERLGAGASDFLGTSVAMAPATVGTNPRLIMGAPETGGALPNSAPGYVVFGVANVVTGAINTITTINGDQVGDRFGAAVVYAGEPTEDGLGAYLIGAPQSSQAMINGTGYVRLFDFQLGIIANAQGAINHERFGSSLASRGDLDGDGRLDLLVGAPGRDAPAVNVGAVTALSFPIPKAEGRILINEIKFGGGDAVELINTGLLNQNLSGMSIRWAREDGIEKTATLGLVNLASGRRAVITATGTQYSESLPGTLYQGSLNGLNTWTQSFVVILSDARGLQIDAVRVSDINGAYDTPTQGELFRGVAVRGPADFAVERIERLDSNSGADWTAQTSSSMGLLNRNSGPRGTDPLALPTVLISEVDHAPDLVELRNKSGSTRSLEGWYFLSSSTSNGAILRIQPFLAGASIVGNGYHVVGEGSAPAELPGSVPYTQLAGGTIGFPFTGSEFAIALYDSHGRLSDMVRAQRDGDAIVHHTIMLPAHWTDFVGAASRSSAGDSVIARVTTNFDTNSGTDWRGSSVRTMGSLNGVALTPDLGHAEPLDARFALTHTSQVMVVVNAGPAFASMGHGYLLSGGHLNNEGPFFGMGSDALDNLLNFGTTPPHMGLLDFRGSTRLDLPIFVPPGIAFDLKFFTFDPANGMVLAQTLVMEIDT